MQIIWMPYEDANREYLARVWMANHFRKFGLTSVILPKYYMDYMVHEGEKWPIGGVVHKGGNKVSSILMLNFKGFINVLIDEETLNVADEEYLMSTLSKPILENTHILLASTTAQENAIKPYLKQGQVIRGLNPRLEMLRSDAVRSALPSEKPNSVLVNTSLGSVNTNLPSWERYAMMCEQVGLCGPENRESFMYSHLEHDNMKQQAFYTAIAHYHIPHKVTIRPHPMENVEHWHSFADTLGVHVSDHSETHLEEMAKAQLVVGYACTSLIEAGFMGKDTVDLNHGNHPWDKYYLQHPYAEIFPESGLDSLGKYFKTYLHDHKGKAPHKSALEKSWNIEKRLTDRQKKKIKFPAELERNVLKNLGLSKFKRKCNTLTIYP